jgi:hypothetical protein
MKYTTPEMEMEMLYVEDIMASTNEEPGKEPGESGEDEF